MNNDFPQMRARKWKVEEKKLEIVLNNLVGIAINPFFLDILVSLHTSTSDTERRLTLR